jgi:hypothetical protein
MAYAYYVVNKDTGRVVAGNEYREDANDAREDSPLPKSQTQVLTAAGVRRKYGKIVWEGGTRRNARRTLSLAEAEDLLHFDLQPQFAGFLSYDENDNPVNEHLTDDEYEKISRFLWGTARSQDAYDINQTKDKAVVRMFKGDDLPQVRDHFFEVVPYGVPFPNGVRSHGKRSRQAKRLAEYNFRAYAWATLSGNDLVLKGIRVFVDPSDGL